MKRTAGQFHVFADESYDFVRDPRRLLAGLVVAPACHWLALSSAEYQLRQQRGAGFLDHVNSLLQRVDGVAVVVFADIPSHRLPSKERDRTADIPDMARTDNLWSVTFAFGLLYGILHTGFHHQAAKRFRIFHDARDLKAAHAAAIATSFRKALSDELVRARAAGLLPAAFCPKFDPLRFVQKRSAGGQWSSSQAGIAHADRLLHYDPVVIGVNNFERLWAVDVTTHVLDYLDNFADTRRTGAGAPNNAWSGPA